MKFSIDKKTLQTLLTEHNKVVPLRTTLPILGCAFFEIKKGHRSNNKLLNTVLPSLGILLIFYSIIFFYDGMLHPSIRTLIPVIGVSLIIWFAHKDELVSKILSSKVFVGTGLISYSLYMWHFPVFAFKRERSLLNLDNQDKFELILICIVLVGLEVSD